jgi:hypothetical protein
MDTFDVNLLSQVQALNKKLSISQEHLNLKRKAVNEDRGKGRYPGKRSPENMGNRGPGFTSSADLDEERDGIIDITV